MLILVDELRDIDPELRIFGAEKHRYEFNDPLDLKDVEAFEACEGIRLPEEYRDFIINIGDGGAGPNYGILTLKEASENCKLADKFPWKSEIILDTDEEYELWESSPGAIVISDRGCSYTDILIVNGDSFGEVWSDFSAVDAPLTPSHKCFWNWYIEWAQRSINTIKREPLIDKVSIGMAVEEVQGILGTNMQRWGDDPDFYYIGFKDTNASFVIDLDNKVKEINKMETV